MSTEKRASVGIEVFVPALISGIVAGQSNRQIAESLGMSEQSFSVRKSQVVKKAKDKALADPTYVNPFTTLPKRSRAGGVDVLGLVEASVAASKVLADLDKSPVVIAPEAVVESTETV